MSEVTYYFNEYNPDGEVWDKRPGYAVNNVLALYAYTSINNEVERLTGNSCLGTDLGTISKVELRAYTYGDGDDELYIRPEFVGGTGVNHITVPGVLPADWGGYQDITNDTNHPSPWTWTALQNLECDIELDDTGKGNMMHVSKVEIRVTYIPSAAGTPTSQVYIFG